MSRLSLWLFYYCLVSYRSQGCPDRRAVWL
uniref:Uncharacterized protein n=1 Tax=Rhizophora mucronata TaxID=61149 RepID=A0A2P2QDZ0_RHIMU